MLKIKIRVKEKEDIRLTIEGSPIRETLELDSFVALNDAINDHFAEMNGGM